MIKTVNWRIAGWDGYTIDAKGNIKYFSKVGNQSKNMDEEIETGEEIKEEVKEESGEEEGEELADEDEENIELPGDE